MVNDPNDKSFPGSSATSASGSSGGSIGSGSGELSGANEQVERVVQGAHQAVDRVQETLTSGTEKLMSMQQEYGDMARERVTSHPLGALGIAFAAGIVLSGLVLPSGKRSSKRSPHEVERELREALEELRPSRTESLSRGLRNLLDLQHGPLHGVAESASNAAHRLERGLGHGGDRLMAMQHEYGGIAREQIKAHPLLLLGVGVGVCAAILKLYDESR